MDDLHYQITYSEKKTQQIQTDRSCTQIVFINSCHLAICTTIIRRNPFLQIENVVPFIPAGKRSISSSTRRGTRPKESEFTMVYFHRLLNRKHSISNRNHYFSLV